MKIWFALLWTCLWSAWVHAVDTQTKIFIVVLENEDYSSTIKQPFMKMLVEKGTLFTSYKGVTHPSQPNYFALVAGTTAGVKSNATVTLEKNHLGKLLDAKNLSWKTYAEDFPGNCDLRAKIGNYVRKHNPLISFKDVQSNQTKCKSNIVSSSQLDRDIAAGTLPDFALYIPNLKNDGHDTGVAYADKFMQKKFAPLMDNPKFMQDMIFIVTFDEGEIKGTNQIYTAFYGDQVLPGKKVSTSYNHYNLLKTIQSIFKLGSLGQNDSKAKVMSGFWK